MTLKQDGGFAFPSLQPQFDNIQIGNGMTLRDWFAGTLPVIDSINFPSFNSLSELDKEKLEQIVIDIAHWRYMLADAMLDERSNEKKETT